MIERRCSRCNKLKQYRNIESSSSICRDCNSNKEQIDRQCINCKKIKLISKFGNDALCNSCKATNASPVERITTSIKKIFCKTCKTNIKENNFSLEGLTQSVCNSCLTSNKKFTKRRVKEGNPGIYRVTNKITKKVYIGQSSNLQKRKSHYFGNNPGYVNKQLKADMLLLGIENFSFFVIQVMPDSTELERLSAEAFHKAKYQPEQLYNVLPGIETKEEYQKWKLEQDKEVYHLSTSNSITQATTITESCI